jgi:glycosyltransferase involved in cell wall biosynthesis
MATATARRVSPGEAASRPLPSLAMIAGIDPLRHLGGHPSYVVAHGLAATAAGFAPHMFCASDTAGLLQTEFGYLHRVAAPLAGMHRAAPVHQSFLAAAVTRHVTASQHPGPFLLHSFGAWASSGVAAARQLGRRGTAAIPLASAYTLLRHETYAKVAALRRHHGTGPRLSYLRDYAWVLAIADRAERRGYEQSRLVLTNYESVRALLRDACKPDLPVRLIPYASPAAFQAFDEPTRMDLPDVLERLRPADAPLILTVARHDARKGQDVLLLALARLKQDGVQFRACLIGSGRLLAANRRLNRQLGLDDRVAIPGRIDDVFEYLRHADIFVLPSHEEGSGSVALLEALQAGTAIVSSRCDGIPEDLADTADALLVEPGDAGELERALAALVANPALRSRLARRARELYETRFSSAALVDALSEVYCQLAAEVIK